MVPASGTWEEHRAVFEARRGMPMYDEAGNFTGYCGVGRNVTARRGTEKALERLASFDAATGLPDRKLVQERLEPAIAQSRRRGRGAGVLLVDLDRFKLVNDTLGYQTGNELLAQVGR